jgi:transcriptional regulator with XRE-family HTH domain
MDFGTKLKKVRKENNLSQDEMAELLFTTQGNYSLYESGSVPRQLIF